MREREERKLPILSMHVFPSSAFPFVFLFSFLRFVSFPSLNVYYVCHLGLYRIPCFKLVCISLTLLSHLLTISRSLKPGRSPAIVAMENVVERSDSSHSSRSIGSTIARERGP